MIAWMLQRMEANPCAVFYEQELLAQFPSRFERAKAERLIRRVPIGKSYGYGLPRSRILVNGGARTIEAIDDEDPEEEPLEVTAADLRRWRLDLDALAQRIRNANDLKGATGRLDHQLYQLGESNGTIFFLGLFADPERARRVLDNLSLRHSNTRGRAVILCPSFVLNAPDAWRFEAAGVCVVGLPEDGPFDISSQLAEASDAANPVPGGQVSRRELTWPPTAAAFVSILRQAHSAGASVLRWAQIKERLAAHGHHPNRARDVRRNVSDWDEVVHSPRQGFYRLKP